MHKTKAPRVFLLVRNGSQVGGDKGEDEKGFLECSISRLKICKYRLEYFLKSSKVFFGENVLETFLIKA